MQLMVGKRLGATLRIRSLLQRQLVSAFQRILNAPESRSVQAKSGAKWEHTKYSGRMLSSWDRNDNGSDYERKIASR